MRIEKEELNKINAGGFKLTAGFILVGTALASFFIGLANGLKRPLSCSSSN